MTLTKAQLRAGGWAGYGVHISRLTDRRLRRYCVCFLCRGPVYAVSRSLIGQTIHCEACGEIRAVEVVEKKP